MKDTSERRREQRLPIMLHLEVSHMFRQDYDIIENLNAEIIVNNISKGGIGFTSDASLPVNYYFNAKIEFDSRRFIYAVLKIVRKNQARGLSYIYGAEFIGLAPFLAEKIEQYGREITVSGNQSE